MFNAKEAYKIAKKAKESEETRLHNALLDFLHGFDEKIKSRCNQGEFNARGSIPPDFFPLSTETKQGIIQGYYERYGYKVTFSKNSSRFFFVSWDNPSK